MKKTSCSAAYAVSTSAGIVDYLWALTPVDARHCGEATRTMPGGERHERRGTPAARARRQLRGRGTNWLRREREPGLPAAWPAALVLARHGGPCQRAGHRQQLPVERPLDVRAP